MIKRAIRNLAENAIRHAPKDTVVEFVVEGNGTVSVQDRGPGISDEERELIFRRFWRRDRNSQGSSGLGLSIVQRIAELHGGDHRGREPGDGRRAVFPAFYSGFEPPRGLTQPVPCGQDTAVKSPARQDGPRGAKIKDTFPTRVPVIPGGNQRCIVPFWRLSSPWPAL